MNNPRYSHKGNDCDTYGGMSLRNMTHLALHSLCRLLSPLGILHLDMCSLTSVNPNLEYFNFPGCCWVCIDKLDTRNEIHFKELSEKNLISMCFMFLWHLCKINDLKFVFCTQIDLKHILQNHSSNWCFLAAHYFFTQQEQILGNKFT